MIVKVIFCVVHGAMIGLPNVWYESRHPGYWSHDQVASVASVCQVTRVMSAPVWTLWTLATGATSLSPVSADHILYITQRAGIR